MKKIYVCTTIGTTRYIDEWLCSIRKINPYKIAIARDLSRSEPLPENLHVQLLNYDTKKPWASYERRHEGWVSDESILKGIILLIEDMLKTDATHFLHIDSDIILSDTAIAMLTVGRWDYLQFGTPVMPRESMDKIMLFWDSTNFGISKTIAEKIMQDLCEIRNPYPVDINIHKVVKKHFASNPSYAYLNITGVKISHYIRGVKVTI
jgi:hypothetical protein